MKNKPPVFVKAHLDTFTRKDGAVVQAHDTQAQAAQADAPITHASLITHPMYSASDHRYFQDKGYQPHQIKEIWDRDHAWGKSPVEHQPVPDVVGALMAQDELPDDQNPT